MCELFNKYCLGCIGLEYNIDKLKKECETYQKYFNEGEQIEWKCR